LRWALPALEIVCLAVTGLSLGPALFPKESPRLEVSGVRQVRHPDFQRIDAALKARAPGWGMLLRSHVAEAIAEESERAGFDPLLVLAIISVESEFQEAAVSIVGAKGLMQVRPTTLFSVAEREGLRLSASEIEADPSLNVRLGVRYLKSMRDQFRGNLDLALMAYNAGPTRVFLSIKERSLEPFLGYVSAVRGRYTMLKVASGEPDDWALASREPWAESATR
jgi:soluble lytic murein transglycosylase-like protein